MLRYDHPRVCERSESKSIAAERIRMRSSFGDAKRDEKALDEKRTVGKKLGEHIGKHQNIALLTVLRPLHKQTVKSTRCEAKVCAGSHLGMRVGVALSSG